MVLVKRYLDIGAQSLLLPYVQTQEEARNAVRYTLDLEPTNALAFLTPPDSFVDFVADAIEAETGIRPALSTSGGTSGCVETGAYGKEAYVLTGYFNLPKILELTLNDGLDPRTGQQLGPRERASPGSWSRGWSSIASS